FLPAQATGQAAKAARTVVISGVPDGLLQDEVMTDLLVIHFQMAKNNGGDVAEVMYPTRQKGVAYLTFEDPEVVESVLKKDEHQLEDKRLSRCYPLRVTPYCENVFSSVTSVLNMSVFQDQFVLEDLVQEIKQKSTALTFGPLQPNGHLAVQGSFPAIQLLRDFLLLKAKSLSEEVHREESESHQRARRRLQPHRATSARSDVHGGQTEVVVIDTDVYHYLKSLFPRALLGDGDVVISEVTAGDTTVLSVEAAGGRGDAGQVLRVKEKLEKLCVKLHHELCKERICLERHSKEEKERYQGVCEHLQPHYPSILVLPYDTHMDVIGDSSEVFQFTKKV
ncbi:RNA-binding protein 43, partial [Merops nubicus]